MLEAPKHDDYSYLKNTNNVLDTLAIEIGCQCGGLVTIPISQDATPSHVSHVLENSGLNVLVVHTALLDRVTAIAAGNNLLHVKHIVIIGGTGATSGSLSKLEASGFKVHQIADIERNGAENPVSFGELRKWYEKPFKTEIWGED